PHSSLARQSIRLAWSSQGLLWLKRKKPSSSQNSCGVWFYALSVDGRFWWSYLQDCCNCSVTVFSGWQELLANNY
ncbi:MAG: hypothetical protein QMD09_14435, partial [Desulfatibacillaceae bacterium]|nr:hypothetical protein [Desulfatibacillaceae bacterium]